MVRLKIVNIRISTKLNNDINISVTDHSMCEQGQQLIMSEILLLAEFPAAKNMLFNVKLPHKSQQINKRKLSSELDTPSKKL